MTFKEMQTAHCATHAESDLDCVDCTIAQQDAACARLAAAPKKAKAVKRSATLSAQPSALINVRHVAGDGPSVSTASPAWTAEEASIQPAVAAAPVTGEGSPRVLAAVPDGGIPREKGSRAQIPLSDEGGNFIAEPSKLGDATVARGFLLAGNAYFTVRSLKTGVRYTYRVNRADCSRCGKKDCQCWKYPSYFVALLTGPDNQGDYTYLGMIRDNAFRATRATGVREQGKPFAAFRYVWDRLTTGVYPPQVEIWHEGRCGKCGRPLTVPESIASGIGPVCAEKGGF